MSTGSSRITQKYVLVRFYIFYSLCKKHVKPQKTDYFYWHLLFPERGFHSSSWLSPSNGCYFRKCCRTLWSNSGRTRSSCCEFSSLSLKGNIIYLKLVNNLPYLKWQQVVSHQRAAAATAAGKFKDEIVPVSTKVRLNLQHIHLCDIDITFILFRLMNILWRLSTQKLVRQNLL